MVKDDMAIWQFKFSLVPYDGIVTELGSVPLCLPEYMKVDVENFDEDEIYPNYWKRKNPKHFFSFFEKRLGAGKDNWADGKIFGSKESDVVEIWNDSLNVALDLTAFNSALLQEILDFSKDENLFLVVNETGKLIPPNYEAIEKEIKNSTALEFCIDPQKTLLGLRKAADL